MNLLNIRTFLYIARYQTISGAAEAMYTTQPTVSSRLSQLEAELGVTLITRHKGHRTIELTEKGQDFIPIAERWLALDRQTMQFCHFLIELLFAFDEPPHRRQERFGFRGRFNTTVGLYQKRKPHFVLKGFHYLCKVRLCISQSLSRSGKAAFVYGSKQYLDFLCVQFSLLRFIWLVPAS